MGSKWVSSLVQNQRWQWLTVRLTVSTNSLSNSLSWAGGISSTFLSSSSLWRKVVSRLTLLSVFAIVFLFLAHLWGHLLFLQGEQILAPLLPFCFYRKPRACCPPLWSTIVRVSDWTNDVFSQSFAFLIGLLYIPDEFYAGFFSCVNLSMFEINVFLPSPSLFRLKVQECTVFFFHRWPDIVRMSHSKNYFCIESARSFDTIHFEMVSIDFM